MFVGLCGSGLYIKSLLEERGGYEETLNNYTKANESLNNTIGRLEASCLITRNALVDAANEKEKINKEFTSLKDKLKDLRVPICVPSTKNEQEKKESTTADYLSTPVPVDVNRVLNEARCKARRGVDCSSKSGPM